MHVTFYLQMTANEARRLYLWVSKSSPLFCDCHFKQTILFWIVPDLPVSCAIWHPNADVPFRCSCVDVLQKHQIVSATMAIKKDKEGWDERTQFLHKSVGKCTNRQPEELVLNFSIEIFSRCKDKQHIVLCLFLYIVVDITSCQYDVLYGTQCRHLSLLQLC